MRTEQQRAGDAAEDLVVVHLERAGWRIVGRNVRVGRAELDIVAVDPGPPAALVVVEVRWRRTRAYGLPEETVRRRKLQRLRAAGQMLALRGTFGARALEGGPVRLDLVAVEPGDGRRGGPLLRHHRGVLSD